jgi:hypothetical protein
MKSKLFAALLSLSIVAFSCTKDEDTPPPPEPAKEYQLPGLYIGTYTITQLPNQTPLRYVMAFEPDGTITTEGTGADNKTYYHEGTWSLNGTEVKATYKTINRASNVVTQSAVLTFNKADGTLTNGTWKDVVNSEGYIDGKFQTFQRVKDNP